MFITLKDFILYTRLLGINSSKLFETSKMSKKCNLSNTVIGSLVIKFEDRFICLILLPVSKHFSLTVVILFELTSRKYTEDRTGISLEVQNDCRLFFGTVNINTKGNCLNKVT